MTEHPSLSAEMASVPETNGHISNRILRALPRAEYERIGPYLEPFVLTFGEVLLEPGDATNYLYFPNNGVISMLTVLENGDVIEIATIGNEGMADLSVFLGLAVSESRLLVQVPGNAMRIGTNDFQELVRDNPVFRAGLGSYMVAMFILVSQSAACNRLHSLEERCARWLLMTHDRVDSDTFPMTQEFLASMLGVRRPSVTVAAGMLQKAGFIRYTRGKLTVLDRRGLEGSACECYSIVRKRFDNLPNGHTKHS